MRQGRFHYLVEVEMIFTGRYLLALFEASRDHYDARCRAASHPAVTAGGYVVHGGELWGIINQLPDIGPLREGEFIDDYMRRACTENADAEVAVTLAPRKLGLLGKIAETTVGDDAWALTDARRVILEALRSAGAEHTRLNPPDPEEEPDDPAHA